MRFSNPKKTQVLRFFGKMTLVEIAGGEKMPGIVEKEPGKNISIDIVKIQMVKKGTIEYARKPISGPQELAELGLKLAKNSDREMFILVCLNAKNFVNCIHLVGIGTLDKTVISPREVMKAALLSNASSIAFVHNHPSGDPEPSPEDISMTNALAKCADLFQIRILDHVVVVDDGRYQSFLKKKIL